MKNKSVQNMVILALFIAIMLLMAFTPLGMIQLPIIKATLLHVPVIIGSVVLGPKKGAILGVVFGLISIFTNTTSPSLLSFAFSPLVPVPGSDHGSLLALVICFIPRILVGIVPYFVWRGLDCLLRHKAQVVALAITGTVGAFVNTGLVMGLIYFVFHDAFALAKEIAADAVLGAILGIVSANGVPEMIVAAVLTPAISLPLMKFTHIGTRA